jgi:DNA-directed RNA polymerase specialized sigma subunit
MTNQEKKAWLRRYTTLDRQINAKLEELSMWRARATKITPTYSGMPKGGGDDRIQSAVENICRIEDEINADIDRLIEIRSEIRSAIEAVEDERLREILALRYIKGLRWEQIAVELHYSYRNICYLHGRALSLVKIAHYCTS